MIIFNKDKLKFKFSIQRFIAWCISRRRWIFRVSRDDVLKHIFEHVRNLGICAVIFGAGHYEARHPFDGDGGPIHTMAVGFFYVLVGSCMH